MKLRPNIIKKLPFKMEFGPTHPVPAILWSFSNKMYKHVKNVNLESRVAEADFVTLTINTNESNDQNGTNLWFVERKKSRKGS